MVVSALVSILFDIGSAVVQSYTEFFQRDIIVWMNVGYFISRIYLLFVFSLYSIAFVERDMEKQRRFNYVLSIPFVIASVLTLLTPWTELVFLVDELGNYTRGPGIALSYIVAIFYIIIGIIHTYINREKIEKKVRGAIYAFVIFTIGPSLIQLLNPKILIEGLGLSLCLLCMYLAIQKPEENTDKDTNLPNREAWFKVIQSMISGSRKFDVVTVTIDDYSIFTQTLGIHAMKEIMMNIGDYLTVQMKVKNVFRVKDNTICIIVTEKENKEKIANAIIERFKSSWDYRGSEIKLKIKMGIISCPKDASKNEEIINYIEALENSNDMKTIFYGKDINVEYLKQKQRIINILNENINNDSIEVFYQPIYSCSSGRIRHAEALVRFYENGEVTRIPTIELIEAAEEGGQILQIGKTVLQKVCKFYKEENLEEQGLKSLEVNLSIVECMNNNLVEEIKNMAKSYDIKSNLIKFEITETAKYNSIDVFKNNINKLTNEGFDIFLDDYGTGYSTMRYIIDLPFKCIKLDKSIVWAAFESSEGREMLESVVLMIKKLGMNVVAEGIETREQALYMKSCGCDYLQGYHIGKPMEGNELLRVMKEKVAI